MSEYNPKIMVKCLFDENDNPVILSFEAYEKSGDTNLERLKYLNKEYASGKDFYRYIAHVWITLKEVNNLPIY